MRVSEHSVFPCQVSKQHEAAPWRRSHLGWGTQVCSQRGQWWRRCTVGHTPHSCVLWSSRCPLRSRTRRRPGNQRRTVEITAWTDCYTETRLKSNQWHQYCPREIQLMRSDVLDFHDTYTGPSLDQWPCSKSSQAVMLNKQQRLELHRSYIPVQHNNNHSITQNNNHSIDD